MEKKKLSVKTIVIMVQVFIVLLVVGYVSLTSVYTVSEQQVVVITQFGKAVNETGAGLHFKIPFIQQAYKVDMTTRGMELGYLSTGTHDASTNTNIESESFMITKDFNFVTIDFYIEWRVSNATAFLFNSNSPEGLLRNILQSEARSVVSQYNVDDVLTTAKSEIQQKMKEAVAEKIDFYGIGIQIVNISIQDAEPPTETVVAAFKNVENAKQNKETEINMATTYTNEIIPKARADADKIVKEAEAIKESRINEANGQVARFNEMYSEYTRNKDVTKMRIYLETMEQILPGVQVYIQGEGNEPLKLLDLTNDNQSESNTQEVQNND